MHNSHGELCRFQTLLTVPSAWLMNTLLSPYQAKKGLGESTQAALVSYVMSAKRHCQMLVWGTVTNPKFHLLLVCALCIDPCFRLYHTEKDYTGEIIKIARTSVRLFKKMFNMFKKMLNMFKKMVNMSKEATQLK